MDARPDHNPGERIGAPPQSRMTILPMAEQQKKSLSSRRSKAFSPRETPENERLQKVLDDCGEWRSYTHGFHTYPGRMHPQIARALLESETLEDAFVLDPFCGSGTTLVEAMLAGAKGLGNDIHPLAVRIARIKTSLWPEDGLVDLVAAARTIGEVAHERARSKAKTSNDRKAHPDEAKWFQPHIRYELSNLLEGIGQVEYSRIQDALQIVLSSLLIKVSNRRSDSNEREVKPNLSRGFTSNFFLKRGEELTQFLREFREAVPEETGSPRIRVGDARDLHWVNDQSVGLVITSPPYLGTYDYFSHQAIRTQILGIEDRGPRIKEIGSRERGGRAGVEFALRGWEDDLRDVLNELARVCKPGANAYFVIGTSRIGGERIENDKLLTRWAKDHGFRCMGIASQSVSPEDSTGPRGRKNAGPRESLIWLQRDERPFPEHLRRPAKGRRPKGEGSQSGNSRPRDRQGDVQREIQPRRDRGRSDDRPRNTPDKRRAREDRDDRPPWKGREQQRDARPREDKRERPPTSDQESPWARASLKKKKPGDRQSHKASRKPRGNEDREDS